MCLEWIAETYLIDFLLGSTEQFKNVCQMSNVKRTAGLLIQTTALEVGLVLKPRCKWYTKQTDLNTNCNPERG